MLAAQTYGYAPHNPVRTSKNVPRKGLAGYFALLAISPITSSVNTAANAHEYAKANPWVQARTALAKFESLQQNGVDEVARPDPLILAAARRFIRQAEAHRVNPPSPYVDPDGEFGFRWASSKGLASVSFMSDGNLVAYIHSTQAADAALEIDEPIGEAYNFAEVIVRIQRVA